MTTRKPKPKSRSKKPPFEKTSGPTRQIQWRRRYNNATKVINEQTDKITQLQTDNYHLFAAYNDHITEITTTRGKLDQLKSTATIPEADALIEQLRNPNCQNSMELREQAAITIHRLARNQITANSTTLAQAAAMQAQRADQAETQVKRLNNIIAEDHQLIAQLNDALNSQLDPAAQQLLQAAVKELLQAAVKVAQTEVERLKNTPTKPSP